MAYGLKYSIIWHSDRRDRLEYHISISERDYAGEVKEANLMGDGLVLTYGHQDDDELVPWKPSTAALTLVCKSLEEDFSNLYTDDPLQYEVSIAECRNYRCALRWRGYISTGSYERQYGRPPFAVKIEANDGMEILKAVPYVVDSNTRYTDTLSIRALLERLVAPIGVVEVNIGYIPKLKPTQTTESCDIIGLSANAIYEAFGNEAPSHYDLLMGVLRHFGLQAFMEGDRMCVRSVSSLSSLERPEWETTLESMYGFAPLDKVPLASTMSVFSSLSYLPPLNSMDVDAPSVEEEQTIMSMLDPARWQSVVYVLKDVAYGEAIASRGKKGVRIKLGGVRLGNYAHLSYTFDNAVTRDLSADISIAMQVYNFGVVDPNTHAVYDATLQMSVALISEAQYRDGGTIKYNPDGYFSLPSGCYLWEPERTVDDDGKTIEVGDEWKKWRSSDDIGVIHSDRFFERFSVAHPLEAPKMSPNRASKLSLSLLEPTTISVDTRGIPGDGETRYRMVVLLRSLTDTKVFAEIVQPTITIAADAWGEGDNRLVINVNGSQSVTYSTPFKEVVADNPTSMLAGAAVIDIRNLSPVSEMVSPVMRSQLHRSIGGKLRAMRSCVTRQLEGEVAVSRPISLHTLWEDDNGDGYYTNYMRILAKRGVAEVQLREMSPLKSVKQWATMPVINTFSYAASDSSALMYIPAAVESIYILRQAKRVVEPLLKGVNQARVKAGIDSMVVFNPVSGSTADYELRAYGNDGELLSYIKSVAAATGITNLTLAIVSTASYDATTQMWVITTAPAAKMTIYLVDKMGVFVDSKAFTSSLGSYSAAIPIAGGFIMRATTSTNRVNTSVHYYNAYGDLESLEDVGIAAEDVIAVNDVYIVTKHLSNGTLTVRERKAGKFGWSASDTTLFTGTSKYISFVDMNCALVLMVNSLGEGIVYDGRTNKRVIIDSGTLGTAQKYMLVGEVVYMPEGGVMREERIVEGAGEIQ